MEIVLMKKITSGLVAAALAVAAAVAAAPAASARPTNHFVLVSNKWSGVSVCTVLRNAENSIVRGEECKHVGKGDKFLFWVPNDVRVTNVSVENLKGIVLFKSGGSVTNLGNERDWCFRVVKGDSGNGLVDGPFDSCNPN
jgi:hypothetical protein